MSDYDPASPDERQARRPRARRLVSNRRSGWIVAAALTCAVIGLSVGLATSPSATAKPLSSGSRPSTSPSGSPSSSSGSCSGSSGDGSNARSGPAPGGAAGTVSSVSTASFTMTTTAGNQQVTVSEGAFTTYQKVNSSTTASSITKDEPVLVLGWTSGSAITATQVILQPTGLSATSSAAQFTCGGATITKTVGQIPTGFSQGSGTLISGSAANQATEAALAAYPGVIVDRVAELSNGEYNVHCIGDSWPHHVFVNQDLKAVGAE
jgi:hypothetical protein